MYNIIQLLIYTFTNRLTKSVHITFNEGHPPDDVKDKLRDAMKDKHKCEMTILFTDNGKPTAFDWFYIKK